MKRKINLLLGCLLVSITIIGANQSKLATSKNDSDPVIRDPLSSGFRYIQHMGKYSVYAGGCEETDTYYAYYKYAGKNSWQDWDIGDAKSTYQALKAKWERQQSQPKT